MDHTHAYFPTVPLTLLVLPGFNTPFPPSFHPCTGPLPYTLSLSGLAVGSHQLALTVGDGTRQFQFLIPFSVSEPCKCVVVHAFSMFYHFSSLFSLIVTSALPLQFQCQSDNNDSAISISCTTNKDVTLECYYDEATFTPCKHFSTLMWITFLLVCVYASYIPIMSNQSMTRGP